MAAVATHAHTGPARRRCDSSMRIPSYSPSFLPTSNPHLPPPRDSRKAHKMLGLITDLPPPTTTWRRNTMTFEVTRPSSSSGITKAQRTLGIVADDVPGAKDRRRSYMGGDIGGAVYPGSLEEKLIQAEKDIRRMSGMGALVDLDMGSETGTSARTSRVQSTSPKEWVDLALEEEDGMGEELEEELVPKRLSPSPPRVELPELPSPSFTPEPVELDAASTQHVYRTATRSRQSSCASSRFHDRPASRIASSRSRGLRASTCPPNFSRPLEAGALKSIPGEEMERDPLSVRYEQEPPTPISPIKESPFAFDDVKEARAHVEEELRLAIENRSMKPRMSFQPQQRQREDPRPKKARWTSLPVSLTKFTKLHHHLKSEDDAILIPDHGRGKDKASKKSKVHLTTENLQRWEDEVGYVPRMYKIGLGLEVTRSPMEVDMDMQRSKSHPDFKRGLPFRTTPSSRAQKPTGPPNPHTQNLLTTPPASPPMLETSLPRPRPPYLSSLVSISFTKRPLLSPLLTPPPSQVHPSPQPSHSHSRTTSHSTTHSRQTSTSSPRLTPSLATQKEIAASTQLSTCIMCREAEHPSTFPTRRITDYCNHPTRVCLECLRGHVTRSGQTYCLCPECGAMLEDKDVRAFMAGLRF